MTVRPIAEGKQRLKSPFVVALVAACCVAVLSGCVSVPTSGPAERIEGQAPACRNCVNVDVAPPSFGDEPKRIVEGYLRATSNYQPNYAIAKQYLTKAAAEKWRPEDGASIYSGTPTASGKSTVMLDGRLIGSLGSDRTYTAKNAPLKVNFGMVSEDGEWRISKPPPGLLVAEYSFLTFYKSYNIYFIGNGTSLVPDPIYLPNLPSQANIASVLMKALLSGPSKWLQPAVTSAIPANTALSVDSVTLQDGVAEVPLSDAVLPLNDRQRSLLTAQVVYTLKQAAGIDSVVFKVNQKPFSVPGADADSFEVPVDAVPPDVDPIPFGAGEQLYAVRGKAVQLVDANAGSPNARPMLGPLGLGKYDVESLAVSVTNTDIAVVTDGGTMLRKAFTSASTPNGNMSTVTSGVTELLRPQFSRYGELWALGRLGGRQRLWMFGAGKPIEVGGPILAGGTVSAFKISPDGARMALVRTTGSRTELGIARINRSDKITVDGWRPLDTNQSNTLSISRIQDVGWLDATDMLVLGASSPGAALAPYRVSEDASRITPEGEPSNWDAVELSVLLGGQTAIIIGRSGQTWKDDGTQWLPFIDKCKTVAFPG
ncbi:MAG: GerMN domain-containing protein [Propionibacteriaceae bacterium]|nr:GerMN domain-containing protein [Propionibacteriaceae bacterium]